MFIPQRLATLAATLAVALAGCTTPVDDADDETPIGAPPTEALEAVPMINHIQFGVIEQDVFIERLTGEPGMVYRPGAEDASSALTEDAPLFATATPTEHDPTFSNSGPFPKGAALGFTLDGWLAARGSAAYLCTDGATGRIDATFTGLVPDGVYTFWTSILEFTDGGITGVTDLPAGAPDGSENAFTADEDGKARFSVAWDGCLDPSTAGPGIGPTGAAQVFAIAYHSDGETYDASPGPFGSVTHVQLFGIAHASRT